jgi:hypothetical protein
VPFTAHVPVTVEGAAWWDDDRWLRADADRILVVGEFEDHREIRAWQDSRVIRSLPEPRAHPGTVSPLPDVYVLCVDGDEWRAFTANPWVIRGMATNLETIDQITGARWDIRVVSWDPYSGPEFRFFPLDCSYPWPPDPEPARHVGPLIVDRYARPALCRGMRGW